VPLAIFILANGFTDISLIDFISVPFWELPQPMNNTTDMHIQRNTAT
jgi:hypothetical protein